MSYSEIFSITLCILGKHIKVDSPCFAIDLEFMISMSQMSDLPDLGLSSA